MVSGIRQPPTDSLHKFCAVGGIVLASTGVWDTLQDFEKYETVNVQLLGRVNEMREHYSEFVEGVNAMSDLKRDMERTSDKSIGKARRAELFRIERRIESHKYFMDSVNVHSDPLLQKAAIADKLWRFHLALGIFCGLVGVVVSGWGFSRWAKESYKKAGLGTGVRKFGIGRSSLPLRFAGG